MSHEPPPAGGPNFPFEEAPRKPNAPEAMAKLRTLYAGAGNAFETLGRTIKKEMVGQCSIPTRESADKIIAAAKDLRTQCGRLEVAAEDWVDAQEPPLRPPLDLPFDPPMRIGKLPPPPES